MQAMFVYELTNTYTECSVMQNGLEGRLWIFESKLLQPIPSKFSMNQNYKLKMVTQPSKFLVSVA